MIENHWGGHSQKYTLSQYSCRDCLTHQGKCKIFRSFLEWNLVVVSQPWCHQGNLFGMTWKFTEVNWEMPGWYEKHRSDWVTFECQKALWNISLAIKEFLRIENGAQYTNYKMNNLTKNWTYPKVSYNASLWTDCTTQWCQCHQTSCHYYHTTWETNKYPLSLHILGDQNFESDLE